MAKLLGILLFSFLVTFVAAIPFINLLYQLKFQRQKGKQKNVFGQVTSIINRLHGWKVGTPNAGGILIIFVSVVLSAIFYQFTKYHLNWTAYILYLTLISFGLLGLYDDIRKFYGLSTESLGLRLRYKLILQLIFALVIGFFLFNQMNLHTISIPIFDLNLDLGIWYIIFAAFVIIASANAVNITDGLDGLVVGLVVIALSAFWVISANSSLQDVTLFIAVILGSLLAFLYFNIFPARVWLGDTGSLSLGAVLAVIALILNSSLVLVFVGLVFVLEVLSVLIQWSSKALLNKKVFLVAPIHHHFEARGWDETKVTMRFWLAGAVSAFIGLFIALL